MGPGRYPELSTVSLSKCLSSPTSVIFENLILILGDDNFILIYFKIYTFLFLKLYRYLCCEAKLDDY